MLFMLFNDYVNNLNKQYEKLKELSYIIDELNHCLTLEKEWEKRAFSYGFKRVIASGTNNALNSATLLSDKTISYYKDLRDNLINIDFWEFTEAMLYFENVANDLNDVKIIDIKENFKSSYKIIHDYKKLKDVDLIVDKYYECISAIRIFIETYKKFEYLVEYINCVNNNLYINTDNTNGTLKIRLLNENNDLNTLIDNLNIIKSIYNNIEKVLSDEETSLKYERLESGSFFAILSGVAGIFLTMKPMLEFGYKVYSEQFSPKAKLELEEKKIKVRGEYLKLLKSAAEANGKQVSNGAETQEILAYIEDDIKKIV